MGKWLNGARVRKREIDGKDTRIAALAAAGAAQIAGQVPVATAGLFARRCPRGAGHKLRAVRPVCV